MSRKLIFVRALITLVLSFQISHIKSECAVYTNNDIIIIPDLQQYASTINVTLQGTITDVNVLNFNGYHTYLDDIDLSLTSPSGTFVMLMDSCECYENDNFRISFDDSASTSRFVCPPNAGITYKPISGPLSRFNGQTAAGTWTLLFNDVVSRDCGFLCSWSLEIATNGSVCSGLTPLSRGCPHIDNPLTCEQIQNSFNNGGNPVDDNSSTPGNKRKVVIKDGTDNKFTPYYIFNWVNYSTNSFQSAEGSLQINNSAKYIYDIKGGNVLQEILQGSSSLDKNYKSLSIDANAINVRKMSYIAWSIGFESGFCNCQNPSKIGSGIGKANIKYFSCRQTANEFYQYLVSQLNSNDSILYMKNDGQFDSVMARNDSTKFINLAELKAFFTGSMLAEDLQYCPGFCA